MLLQVLADGKRALTVEVCRSTSASSHDYPAPKPRLPPKPHGHAPARSSSRPQFVRTVNKCSRLYARSCPRSFIVDTISLAVAAITLRSMLNAGTTRDASGRRRSSAPGACVIALDWPSTIISRLLANCRRTTQSSALEHCVCLSLRSAAVLGEPPREDARGRALVGREGRPTGARRERERAQRPVSAHAGNDPSREVFEIARRINQTIVDQEGRSGPTMETAPGLHCAVTRAPGSGEGPRCRLRGNSPEIEACLLRTTRGRQGHCKSARPVQQRARP